MRTGQVAGGTHECVIVQHVKDAGYRLDDIVLAQSASLPPPPPPSPDTFATAPAVAEPTSAPTPTAVSVVVLLVRATAIWSSDKWYFSGRRESPSLLLFQQFMPSILLVRARRDSLATRAAGPRGRRRNRPRSPAFPWSDGVGFAVGGPFARHWLWRPRGPGASGPPPPRAGGRTRVTGCAAPFPTRPSVVESSCSPWATGCFGYRRSGRAADARVGAALTEVCRRPAP